jgi:glutathione synthase/RimK-type ligase-like ATP-grasp enzyme
LWHDAGYEVYVLGSERLAVCRSTILAGRILCPPGPRATALAAREHLSSARGKTRARYRKIVLADEPTLWAAFDLGATEWMEDWCPVAPGSHFVALLRSKTEFLCASRAAGISTPPFQVCATEEEAREATATFGFPVYMKASKGWAGSGLLFADSAASFEVQVKSLSFEAPLLLQKEITGPSASVSVLYDRGVPVCWFAYLMQRTWPNRFSSACSVRLFPHPDAEHLVDAVGRLTEFTGLAGIDFICEQGTNRLLLLEFNPRPTPVYHLGCHAGVDFAGALREMASGPATIQLPYLSSGTIDLFPQMLFYAVEHLNPLLFLRCLGDIPWKDPALTIAQFRRFLTHYIPKTLKERIKN